MNDHTSGPREAAAEPSPIARFFDEMATGRNTIFQRSPVLDYEQSVRARAVLRELAPSAGETILDVGCGNARDMLPILGAGARVVGLDLSPGMIEEARRDLEGAGHRDVELVVGSATDMRFPAASFDKALCSEVIEHVPDAAAVVRELRRVLKSGGTLVLSTPNRASWYGVDRYVLWERLLRRKWNHPFDQWRRLADVRSLLEENGFELVRAGTVCFVPGFLLTYRLPRSLQALIVRLTGPCERLMTRVRSRHGYLIVVKAVAKRPQPVPPETGSAFRPSATQ